MRAATFATDREFQRVGSQRAGMEKGGKVMSANPREERAVQEAPRIRDVLVEDREGLLEMYRAFEPLGEFMGLPPRHDAAGWLERLTGCPAVLAEEGGRVIAHGAICRQGESAEVVLFVRQEHRGRGLGRAMLAALIGRAQALGLRRLWGTTEPGNVAMMRLARSFGFLPGTEPEEFELGVHSENAQEPQAGAGEDAETSAKRAA